MGLEDSLPVCFFTLVLVAGGRQVDAGWQDGAGCWWEVSIPSHLSLSIDCLHVIMIWQLITSRAGDPKEGKAIEQ